MGRVPRMSSVPDKNRKMKNMKKCMNFDCNKLYICVLKVISRHMERIIEMSIENCRAIKKADIELNGITVVSGINGCGKTTMSKMLYYIFKNTNDFESLAVSFFRSKVRKYCLFLFYRTFQFTKRRKKDIIMKI